MGLRAPNFPAALADAPEWVSAGVTRFENLQRASRRDLGHDPSAYLSGGDDVYFPNAVMHWNAGMIGVVVAIIGVAGFVTLMIVSAAFMDGVPAWSWFGLAGSVVFGLLSLVYTGLRSQEPTTVRRDGMYLLPEGAAFVRGGMCSWASRSAIKRFEVHTITGGTSSYREALALKTGDRIELAAGKQPTLREVAEAWRTRA